MFEKYLLERARSTSVNASISVEEHRAPTDESIRLLNEMQEKAELNLVKKYTIEDNDFKGNIFIFRDLFMDQYNVNIVFTLNGKQYITKKNIKYMDMTKIEAKRLLKGAICEAVYEQIMSHVEEVR